MKTIKYLLIFAIGFSSLTSCVDDNDPSADNGTGNNIAGFLNSSKIIGGIASGDSYDHNIKFSVKGPTSGDLSSDVVVSVEADPSSTAIEGVHYEFATNSITLTNANNYLGELPITMLSEGIAAPLDVSPILNLRVTNAATGENVVGSGKLLPITFNYLCFSDLSGDYDMVLNYVRESTGTNAFYTFVDTFVETGTGEYRTTIDHAWGNLGVGTPGFTFFDVCNAITIPAQYLADYYSNEVKGVFGASFVDPVTGIIYMEYTICASDCREYFVTWTPR